jgi:hypothetical protein
VIDTAKIKMRAGLLYTPAFLYNYETLNKYEALKTLSTEIFIIKDLTVRRLFNEGRREGSDASFDLRTEMGRAIRVGRLESGYSKQKNTILRISILKCVCKATASSKSRIAVK